MVGIPARRMVSRFARGGRLVRSTVRRDLLVRKIRREDNALGLHAESRRAVFGARPPLHTRRLPAKVVELQSSRAYSESVKAAITESLSASGVPWLSVPSVGDRMLHIAIRAEDIEHAIGALDHGSSGALIGWDRWLEDPSTLSLSMVGPAANEAAEAKRVFVLIPAVTLANGETTKRYGFECAVAIDLWSVEDGASARISGVWNPWTSTLPDRAFAPAQSRTREVRDALPFDAPHLMQVTFPIDAVFTWVDGTDPEWLARKRQALEQAAGERMPEAAADDLRFVGHDELRYSLRSIEQYAPWIRHVYIVTDRQRPDWLREDTDWISVVDHRDIAPAGTVLPTFNSQAIETNLHRIEGLSEHFLYFNDDMFLSSPVSPDLFFHANGLSSVYLSRAHVAPGPPIEGEPAPDAAGKNARLLIEEVCGRRLSRKLFHAPYALKRSVSYEIEERWPDVVQRTRDSQFRRLHDVTLAGGLHLNYAYAVGKAVTRKIRYRYVGIGELTAQSELERLMRDKDSLQTFCLNDAVQEIPSEEADRQVRAFLARRFPDVGSFERPNG